MKRSSWNDKQTERLSAELRSKGNTREAWEEICDFNDLPAMQAAELGAQCGIRLEVEKSWLEALTDDVTKEIEPSIPAKLPYKDYNAMRRK